MFLEFTESNIEDEVEQILPATIENLKSQLPINTMNNDYSLESLN